MSKLNSLLLKNPKVAAKFMTGMPASYWEKSGRKRALGIFRLAATKVPAYREFLDAQGVNHRDVRGFDDFRSLVPIADKQSYMAGRSLEQLLAHPISDTHLFHITSGTTAGSMLISVSRETMRNFPPALAAMLDLQWDICDPNTRVVFFNCMSLGAWAGGTMTSAIFTALSDRFPNISYAGPGADVDRLLDMLEGVRRYYDIVVLMSYPSFIKEALHAGLQRGIDWQAMNTKVMMGGEALATKLRQEIADIVSVSGDINSIFDDYGASEFGNTGIGTPLSNTILRLARENPALCEDIFGGGETHSLFQNNPIGSFVEIIDGQIVCTSGNSLPAVRYSSKDLGRLMGFEEMMDLLRSHGVDLARSLAEDGYHRPVFKWPFLAVLGRADNAVSIFGAKVSVASIQDLFADDGLIRRFALSTDNSGVRTDFWVHLELPRDAKLTAAEKEALAERYGRVVLERLLAVNVDFTDAYSINPEAALPRVAIHEQGSGPFAAQTGAFKPKSIV